MCAEFSINVTDLTKKYKLYDKPSERLKESLLFSRKIRHKDFYALKNVSFQVEKGETFGIIGTNGAGKSTLLKMITGVSTPTTGNVSVEGKISALLELGAGFNMNYSGIENIYLNGMMMGFTRSEMQPKISGILEFADIGDFINQPVKTYSSGMFARLAFAVAINIEPEILIVDEALSVGDVFFQNKCYKKFEELRSNNTTVIFVSHDIATVKQLCSRVLWLEHGEMQMVGDSVEVCNAYTNSILKRRIKSIKEGNLNETIDNAYEMQELKVEQYPKISYTNESILSDDVEIVSCFVENRKQEIVSACKINEKHKAVVIFKSKIEIESAIVGFVIETIKGLWVINCNSAIYGDKTGIHVQANSTNRVDFEFVMPPLMNGDYVLGAAVSEGTMEQYKVHTWLYNVGYVQIADNVNNTGLIEVNAKISVFGKVE